MGDTPDVLPPAGPAGRDRSAADRPVRRALMAALVLASIGAGVSGFLAWQRSRSHAQQVAAEYAELVESLRRLAQHLGLPVQGRPARELLREIIQAVGYDGPIYDRELLRQLLAKDMFSLDRRTLEAYDRLARRLAGLAAATQTGRP